MKNKSGLFVLLLLQIMCKLTGQNINYTALHTESSIESIVTNTSLATGSIAGAASVNVGASGYKIDIALPPGTNGVEPEIFVQYNSLGGSSAFGYGWALGGLSAISRTGRNLFHDGTTSAPDFSENDRYVLNGQRMKLISGTYGLGGSVYAFESEGFERITAYGGTLGDPSYFIMETKDGIKYEYGKEYLSRHESTSGKAISWHLSKMIYPDGNYINYKYKIEHNWSGTLWYEHVIDEIHYTGNANANIEPYALVKFQYLRKNEESVRYLGGAHDTRGLATVGITVSTEGQSVKFYDFIYGYRKANTFLHEVQERSADGTAINKTAFKYGDLPSSSITTSPRLIAHNDDYFTCNLDGDGITDFLYARRSASNPEIHTFFHGNSNVPFNINVQPAGRIVSVADFNGDNLDDVIEFYGVTETSGALSYYSYRVKVHHHLDPNGNLSFNNNFVLTPSSSNPMLREALVNTHLSPMYTGDFNGDGLADLLYVNGERLFIAYGQRNFNEPLAPWQMVTSNISSFTSIYDWGYNIEKLAIIDFNGDGKSDIFVIDGAKSAVFEFETNTNVKEIFYNNSGSLTLANRLFDQQFVTLYGDFNGDGNTDVLVRRGGSNSAPWYVYYSKANGFEIINFGFAATPVLTQNDFDVYVGELISIGDFNGDGRSDVMMVGQINPLNTYVDVYYSKGFSFEQAAYTALNGVFFTYCNLQSSYLGNDGKAVSIYRLYTNQDPLDVQASYKSKENLLVKIKNGEKYTTLFDYKLMNEKIGVNDDFYTRGPISSVSSATTNIAVPAWLVKEFLTENGTSYNSGNYTSPYMKAQYFRYFQAKLHRGGKGLLGFGKMEIEDKWSFLRSVYHNHPNETYGIMVQDSVITEFVTGSSFTKSVTQFNITNAGTGRYLMTPSSAVMNNFYENRRTDQLFNSYDLFANPTVVTNNIYSGNPSQLIESKVVNTVYDAFGSSTPDKPTSITTTLSRTGQSDYTSTATISYNSNGQVTQRKNFAGMPKEVLFEYEYLDHGGLWKETKKSTGLIDEPTYYFYDVYGRFVEQKRNILNLGVYTATYDPRWGKPLTVTDATQKTTTNTYDVWGRIKTATSPAGITVTKDYQWQIGPGIKKEITTAPGRPTSITHYDQMDREVKSEQQGFGGHWITQIPKYDHMGNMYQSTSPYKSGEPILTTTQEFGVAYTAQRLKKTIPNVAALGQASYDYQYIQGNEKTIITRPDTKTESTEKDATGKTIRSTDTKGTILDYTYYSHGGLKEVKLGGTVLVSVEYDEYNRKKKQTDISAGITQYDYDAYGRLTSETNAKGQTTTTTYDNLSRVHTITRPEGVTTYEYWTHFAIGKAYMLQKVTGHAGDIYEIDYDQYSRVTSETITVDGQSYTTTIQYDDMDRVASRTLPSGLTLQYEYDDWSYLKRIYSGATTYVTIDEVNGRGQVTKYTLGDGKQSTYDYFHGIPVKYFTTDGSYEYNMQWDYKNGNLMKRWDQYGNKDTMEYDILDRLARWTTTSSTMAVRRDTITYADNGNILSKTDVGTYAYDATRIYATTEITNPHGLIRDAQQHITYNSFLQPDTIREGAYTLVYTYGYHGNRIKSVLSYNGVIKETKYYLGETEKVISDQGTVFVQYITVDGQLKVIISSEGDGHTPHYVYTDHLGSIVQVTNTAGNVVYSQNFDPWGRRRYMGTWTYIDENVPNNYPIWLYRGYTGHEHLSQFKLINMNGRIYDPELARILSPDNYIQDGGYSQNYNRYSYAYNNPLKYTDPSGNSFLSAILINVSINLFSNGVNNLMNNRPFFQGALKSAFIGIVSAGASFGIGQLSATVGNEFLRAGIQVVAHAHVGGFFAKMQGGRYLDGFISGGISSGLSSVSSALKLGPVTMITVGAISGGLSSAATGGNFWEGLRHGFVVSALNHYLHEDVVEDVGGGDPPSRLDQIAAEAEAMRSRWDDIKNGEIISSNNLTGLSIGSNGIEFFTSNSLMSGPVWKYTAKSFSILNKAVSITNIATSSFSIYSNPSTSNILSQTYSISGSLLSLGVGMRMGSVYGPYGAAIGLGIDIAWLTMPVATKLANNGVNNFKTATHQVSFGLNKGAIPYYLWKR